MYMDAREPLQASLEVSEPEQVVSQGATLGSLNKSIKLNRDSIRETLDLDSPLKIGESKFHTPLRLYAD